MHSVPGRQSMIGQQDLLRPFYHGPIHGQDFIHDPENNIECDLNVLTSIYG